MYHQQLDTLIYPHISKTLGEQIQFDFSCQTFLFLSSSFTCMCYKVDTHSLDSEPVILKQLISNGYLPVTTKSNVCCQTCTSLRGVCFFSGRYTFSFIHSFSMSFGAHFAPDFFTTQHNWLHGFRESKKFTKSFCEWFSSLHKILNPRITAFLALPEDLELQH